MAGSMIIKWVLIALLPLSTSAARNCNTFTATGLSTRDCTRGKSSCRVTCNTALGYFCVRNGCGSTFVCQSNGVWTGTAPNCVVSRCSSISSNPLVCANGGVCSFTPSTNTARCICPVVATGATCEISRCNAGVGCSGRGTCLRIAGQFTCRCNAGSFGPACNQTACPGGCLNGGQCVCGKNGVYSCKCASGWMGIDCSVPVTCTPPCVNNGTCYPNSTTTTYCKCPTSFVGAACESNIFCGTGTTYNPATGQCEASGGSNVTCSVYGTVLDPTTSECISTAASCAQQATAAAPLYYDPINDLCISDCTTLTVNSLPCTDPSGFALPNNICVCQY